MANLSSLATSGVVNLLAAPSGVSFALNSAAQSLGSVPSIPLASLIPGNASPDLLDQSAPVKYPIFAIYCEKLSNTLKEKYRTFSGTAQVVIEVRHSQDQVLTVQSVLDTYVSAVCQILDASRGDWSNGLFYSGGYEVVYGPLKRGGLNFLQIAKVSLVLDISA